MKKMGVEKIISVSAVGSMKEEYLPGHFVVPDQFIDRTHRRISTFFDKGMVGHVSLAAPTCISTGDVLFQAAEKAGVVDLVNNNAIQSIRFKAIKYNKKISLFNKLGSILNSVIRIK